MRSVFFLLLLTRLSIGLAHAQYDTITTPAGLKYIVLQKGAGAQPVKGQKVKVHYTGKLANGKVFDTSRGAAGPFKFTIGAQEVIPGWDVGFTMMHEGEKGILIVPPLLAYGSRGVPDDDNPGKYIIPPNATLTFEVELISVK